MLGAKQAPKLETTEYATAADFCRIFASDMNGLYLLSYLLTGDPVMAEQCFVGGLEDSTKGNAVFKEWARSWARRMIIQNAILKVRPQAMDGSLGDTLNSQAARVRTERPEIAALAALPAFERFVFVISVLEGYSAKNCSLLLGCTHADAIAARTRALRNIGILAELQQQSQHTQRPETDSEVRPQFKGISMLAVSA